MTPAQLHHFISHLKATNDYPPYFSPEEFECGCEYPDCPKTGIQIEMVWRLSVARILCGFAVPIGSGWRCEKHNADINGSEKSAHMSGWAVDPHTQRNSNKFILYEAALEAGFNRIGVYTWGLHLDMSPIKAPNLLWRGES